MIFVSIIIGSLRSKDIAASFKQRDRYSNVLRKLQVLLDQLDEARWIKKNIEKRSRKVSYI